MGEYGEYVRLALTHGLANHPEIVQRKDALLCRIEMLLRNLCDTNDRSEFPPLGGAVFEDLKTFDEQA
jgi:hypothetical protein